MDRVTRVVSKLYAWFCANMGWVQLQQGMVGCVAWRSVVKEWARRGECGVAGCAPGVGRTWTGCVVGRVGRGATRGSLRRVR